MKRLKSWIAWPLILIQGCLPLLTIGAQMQSPFSSDREDNTLSYSAAMTQGAQALASDSASDAARSLATGAASGEIQRWLSQFGTAKIQLNTDRHGSWSRSSADMLVPLYDNGESLLFLQGGLRKPSDRLTGNLGAGVRTFWHNGWMFGGNVFFDEDFTGHNRRVGFGGEAWRDYLRLSANTYIGTTNWHTSRDYDGSWQEKPADGYDIRAQAWLPVYPQLGGKLVWEQYYGAQVALFDKDHLQRNPHAVTAGVEYTPVPLVTFGVEQKQGRGEHDTQLSLGVSWQFGHDWRWQLDPANVQAMRTLAGNRYDLVDRNNEIVMQYRKAPEQGVAHLALSVITDNSPADGVTRNVLSVTATNRSGQPVRNAPVSWTATGENVGLLSSSVTDSNGQAKVMLTSATVQTVSVTAQSGSVSATQSSHFVAVVVSQIVLNVIQDNAPADGSSTNVVEATLTDSGGRPVSGQKVSWGVSGSVTLTGASGESDSNGKAVARLSSLTAGNAAVTAKTGSLRADGTVHFADSGDGAAANSSMTELTVTSGAKASGSDANTATATVKDDQGNILADTAVTFSVTGSAKLSATTVKTDAKGQAQVTLTSTQAETVNVTATLANGNSATKASTFVVDLDSAVMALTSTSGALANGIDANTVTVTLTDKNGQPLSGQAVNFSTEGSAVLSSASAVTDSNGKVVISVTDTSGEYVNVTATIANGASKEARLFFQSTYIKEIVVNTPNPLAGVYVTVYALIVDLNQKPVSGETVTFSVTGNAKLTTSAQPTTGSNGHAVIKLTNDVAETVTLTATHNGFSESTNITFN
ncbi:inverse autotransporter beta domain-containing protein [Pantoea sp. BAV 3049]|uniref:inverse autotransporter beta domain-containing protein n=1 Tax=Pantoea sp. BAV 3049 TaxID=2654188 RepID=UPI00131CCEFC|nr:inverse autotransporter beta domain-containing protein [Pantoea sp. BAV 3049]